MGGVNIRSIFEKKTLLGITYFKNYSQSVQNFVKHKVSYFLFSIFIREYFGDVSSSIAQRESMAARIHISLGSLYLNEENCPDRKLIHLNHLNYFICV